MDLKCKLGHMLGKTVSVDGEEYSVGEDGYIRGVSDVAAKALLENGDAWVVVRDAPPVKEPVRAPVSVTGAAEPPAPPSADSEEELSKGRRPIPRR